MWGTIKNRIGIATPPAVGIRMNIGNAVIPYPVDDSGGGFSQSIVNIANIDIGA